MIVLSDKQKSEGWRIVKFGDVAQEIKANTKKPLSEGISRYVGLEHLDPDSLRLSRYGLIEEDNPTFTKKFNVGDILFGRRRAYLKKAAVAEFIGICSGDITVISNKGDFLLPGLLPFIVQSGMFFNWAIKHSAGGLSPRTKFKLLAEFEFPLPPLSRQEAMLNVLNSVENNIQILENLIRSLEKYEKKILARLFRSQHPVEERELKFKSMKLEQIVTLAYGKSPSEIKNNDGINPIYGTGGVVGHTFSKISDGPSIIIGRKGTLDRPIYVEKNFWSIDTTYYCTDVHKDVDIKWLYYYFCAIDLKKYDESSGVPSLSRNTLYKISLKIPQLEDQYLYISLIDKISSLLNSKNSHLKNLKSLRGRIIQEYLS